MKGNSNRGSLGKRILYHKELYMMLIPVIAYFIIFKYIPMFGLLIAFQDYSVFGGIFNSEWIGLKNFIEFLTGRLALSVIRNTILINVYSLIFSFPMPIIFALLLNEVTQMKFKRTIQTITYMPHFISMVVVVSMLSVMLSPTYGVVGNLMRKMGLEPIFFMGKAEYFRTLYITSGIWQETGWGSVIYLAAISGIDPSLYEAAVIDGASRFK
ncbi:MAG: sugar ABC transporter permease, partial [Clostridiales bacterium]|nr:sugar ABC transporter permease [Clostridiales bacterium]